MLKIVVHDYLDDETEQNDRQQRAVKERVNQLFAEGEAKRHNIDGTYSITDSLRSRTRRLKGSVAQLQFEMVCERPFCSLRSRLLFHEPV